jgi:hypothetical protein
MADHHRLTTSGIVGSMCHGAGLAHKAINDFIRSIDFVDANGLVQSVTEPRELQAAVGCFGLLGIITHVTYEVRKLTYACMQPRKVKTMLAIPPPDLGQVPKALNVDITPTELQDVVDDFERRAGQDHYAEWSWFSYQSDVLVNTWSTVADGADREDYTTPIQAFLQWIAA